MSTKFNVHAPANQWVLSKSGPVASILFLVHLAIGTPAFAAVPGVPGSPTPGSTSSPGPTLSSSTVALDWSTSSGATYYDLGVRDMATNQLVIDTQVTSSAYTASLGSGKPYRWNVAACNAEGCSAYTTARYFQTPASVPAVPGSPTPGSTSSPGPTMSSSTVALDWSSSSGATYYDLGVRDMATNELVVDTQVSSSAYTANLAPGKPYRWNVAACNTAGCSAFTSYRYFQTPSTVPGVPGSPTPGTTSSPGPTLAGATVDLDWSTSSGATYYDLGVRDVATNQLVVDTQVTSSAYSANLTAGKAYRWNVAACNAAGCSAFTDARYFQTPAAVPGVPGNPTPGTTSSPGPTLASTTVALDWDNSSGATYYDLGVRDVATNQLVVDTQVTSSAYTANLSAGRAYRWNVAACNAVDCSAFTEPRYFQTPATTPEVPGGPSPGSITSPGPELPGSSVELVWNPSLGATYYDLGVRDLATDLLVVDTQVTGSGYTADLEPGKPYRWNVAACNAAGCSAFTQPRYFSTGGGGSPDIAITPLTLTYDFTRVAPLSATRQMDWDEVSRLEEKVLRDGTLRVIVGLDERFVPEGALATAEQRTGQRAAIAAAQAATLSQLDGTEYRVLARFQSIPYLALELDATAFSRLIALDRLASVHEDVAVPAALASSAPVIGAPEAWDSGFDGGGQVVAILDTGVDKTHPYFDGGRVVAEACFSSSSASVVGLCPGGGSTSTAPGSAAPCSSALPGCDHGTHVAGIAVGDDGQGPNFGIARGAGLIAVQVFSRFDDAGSCGGSAPCIRAQSADLIQALLHVFDLSETFSIAAVNLSLGAGRYYDRQSCDQVNPAFKAAVDQLRSVGIATVVATGNDGYVDSIAWPACTSTAVSVGGTEDDDDLYNNGNVADFVDLMAPGVSVVSAVPGGASSSKTGTSMATPHVTGAWALLKQQAPGASVTDLLGVLRATAIVLTDDRPEGEVTDLRRIRVDLALESGAGGQTFVISNAGDGMLSVTSVALDEPAPWISWSPQAPFELGPGESVTVTVAVDPDATPTTDASRRLLVTSNDPDESPYPEGVFILIEQSVPPDCHALQRSHGGLGDDPIALPSSSPGCPDGEYEAGTFVELTAAPQSGWEVSGWSGTSEDSSTSLQNSLVMPDSEHTVEVLYAPTPTTIFSDGFESGGLSAWFDVLP